MRLVQTIENVDPYFHFKRDAYGRAGLSSLQKCVVAFLHTESLLTRLMSMFV
jgi:hypothetical protein